MARGQVVWIPQKKHGPVRGTVALWLVCLPLDWVVWVHALAGEILLCSWGKHLTLTGLLFTQMYKWVEANLMLEVTLQRTSFP